jgi:hypothetical protein
MSMAPVLSNGRNIARKLQLALIADASGREWGSLEEQVAQQVMLTLVAI